MECQKTPTFPQVPPECWPTYLQPCYPHENNEQSKITTIRVYQSTIINQIMNYFTTMVISTSNAFDAGLVVYL